MKYLLHQAQQFLKKLIAPPFCSYCREYQHVYAALCDRCNKLIKPVISTHIALANSHMHVHTLSAYEDPLRTLILAKSWSDYTAATKLGELLSQHSLFSLAHYDYIVPMPLHYWRFAYRGFNQTEIIAQIVSSRTSIPVLPCLERMKHSAFQSLFPRSKRYENVKGAFNLKPDYKVQLTGKRVLLLDDVMTTGSTLYEAGQALHAAQLDQLEALVACRAM